MVFPIYDKRLHTNPTPLFNTNTSVIQILGFTIPSLRSILRRFHLYFELGQKKTDKKLAFSLYFIRKLNVLVKLVQTSIIKTEF